MKPSVILASSSPYRKELLKRIIDHFECHSPDIDEDIYKKSDLTPIEIATRLSFEKGNKIFKQLFKTPF
jgi:septum formation protein